MPRLSFYDGTPPEQSFRKAVIDGLSREAKSIPPKFFYDEQGSRLFDLICRQPEYYLPRVERKLLKQIAPELSRLFEPGWVLIEPGVGSGTKVRLIMDALQPCAFVPMDISFDYLKSVASQLAREYAWLSVHAVHADFSHSLPIPDEVPRGRRLLFFPGSTLGNFEPQEAVRFLRQVHEVVERGGMLLIGVDTKKAEALLRTTYNDAAGITAQFNCNLLHRMQRELGAELQPECFVHRAFYNAAAGRVEMHLVSTEHQRLRIDGHEFFFARGETLHTENSYKYAPDEFLQLAKRGGFCALKQWLDSDGMFAIYLLAAE